MPGAFKLDNLHPVEPILFSKFSEIGRSGFFTLLQDQELLQNQKQDLLPVSEAPV